MGLSHHCKGGSVAFTPILWDTVKYYRTKEQKTTLKKKLPPLRNGKTVNRMATR
jgi:hypothetical protein